MRLFFFSSSDNQEEPVPCIRVLYFSTIKVHPGYVDTEMVASRTFKDELLTPEEGKYRGGSNNMLSKVKISKKNHRYQRQFHLELNAW